jgi:hypothetical protein
MPYVNDVGFKKRDTSYNAAKDMSARGRAGTLRRSVLNLLKFHKKGLTADECAAALNETVLAIRPRVSELVSYGILIDTGGRRPNDSGKKAIVWKYNEQENNGTA